ncbi:phage/plasmid primase, P4 family [Rhodococcus opacus]|uniref:Phage/plasmid primase, P4 family n=1 Tax=Rhodococcus opacus TaxID=37919 RepID=A0AAX3YA21_RHOOP|nr:DNA primase family protein [Rhodococcus opacus]MCZ4586477.1 phage/plasmid primase, P4 family [Rhodococcus opacus]WLF45045.1 phage/plasmid primase, P4 family [Rhodococcus opacus]
MTVTPHSKAQVKGYFHGFLDGDTPLVTPNHTGRCMTNYDDGHYPSPDQPYEVAKRFNVHGNNDLPICHWRGSFYEWAPSDCWQRRSDLDMRQALYGHLSRKTYIRMVNGDRKEMPWNPNKAKIANVLDALAAATHRLDSEEPFRGNEIPLRNGWLNVTDRTLSPLTPERFHTTTVPLRYDPDAPTPARWLAFLEEVLGDDPDAPLLLQEWFGYVLSGRTDMQKMLFVKGPKRSGKGTMSRVLEALVGKGNYTASTLGSFGDNFGLQHLIGKSLVVVGDARMRTASDRVTERLLSISGEDAVYVDVKNREPWNGQLPVRIMILSNEVPTFRDSSMALAHRFLMLEFGRSFFGNENPNLLNELVEELPGILLWSLDGLDRLTKQRRFTVPASSASMLEEVEEVMSPVKAFAVDALDFGTEYSEETSRVYAAYALWCDRNGHDVPSRQRFGSELSSALGVKRSKQRRVNGVVIRDYPGIRLKGEHQ